MNPAPFGITLSGMANHLENLHPDQWRVACPKNITPPGGHYSPRDMAACLLGCIQTGETLGYESTTGARQAVCMINLLAKHNSPVFFLGSELTKAFVLTDPPSGVPMDELKWPFDAFTLVLPRNALKSPKDGYIHAISVGRQIGGGGDYLPKSFCSVSPSIRNVVLLCGVSDNGMMFHLTRDYKPEQDIRAFAGAIPEGDKFILEDSLSLSLNPPATQEDIDADVKFTNYLLSLVFQTMLFMEQRPEGVKEGSLSRPASTKKGKERSALWSPNLIGFDYKLKHEGQVNHSAGDGSTVRPHWRRGHHRFQAYGQGRQLRKSLWIEPVFVGSPA